MDKVIDPTQIAQGIAKEFSSVQYLLIKKDYAKAFENNLAEAIAAALREYGQAEYLNGITAVHKNTTEIEQKADAKGFERGKKEIRDACSQHQNEQYAEGYQRGFADGAKDVELIYKQRGTGGGE